MASFQLLSTTLVTLFLFINLINDVFGTPVPVFQSAKNPEESAGYFEGDIILNPLQKSFLLQRKFGMQSRNGIVLSSKFWPNATIPYQFNNTFTKEQKDYIKRGLNTIELVTCIKFVERKNETEYISITNQTDGCYSEVGRQGGEQILNLAPNTIENGCFRLATIMHEFIHALGFYHMQSSYDRDDYLIIYFENISAGTESNFEKYNSNEVSKYGVKYDYDSVMHYPSTAFSKNGQATIVTIDPKYNKRIGQRIGLSRRDIEKLNRMYECDL